MKKIPPFLIILLLLSTGCTGEKTGAPEAVSPPAETASPAKNATALEMKRGLEYIYLMESADGSFANGEVHLFVTDESDSAWSGIVVKYEEADTSFLRFELGKAGFELTFSEELEAADLEKEVPLSSGPQLNPSLYPLLVPYIQNQYGVSIEDLSEWEVRLEGEGGSPPITLSFLGQTERNDYDVLELKMQASQLDKGLQIYASTFVPYLLVEAVSGEPHWEKSSIRLIGVEEREFSLEELLVEETDVEEDLEEQVRQLQEELDSKEEEIEELKKEIEGLKGSTEEEEKEMGLEDYVNISILRYTRYVECIISYNPQYCTKLDISVENTGTETIDFDPIQNSWLEDDKGVQYSVVSAKDDQRYSAERVYPDSKRRGVIYYQPAVPVDVKHLTFYAVVEQQVLNRTIF